MLLCNLRSLSPNLHLYSSGGRCGSAVTSHSSFQLASLWRYGAPGAAGARDGQKDESVFGQLQPSWFGGLAGSWGGGLLNFMVTLCAPAGWEEGQVTMHVLQFAFLLMPELIIRSLLIGKSSI